MDIEDRITAALVPVSLRPIDHAWLRWPHLLQYEAETTRYLQLDRPMLTLRFGCGAHPPPKPMSTLALANLPLHGVSKLARTPVARRML